jgi:beta-barrel assembly-enhancing protease
MTLRRILIPLVLGLGLSGSAAAIEPFLNAADTAQVTGDEKRLWDQAKEFDDIVRKAGFMLPDDQFERYLQQIADRLYPEFHGVVRIRLVRSPILNAFALPNGSVYVHQGLAARFQNEAQLATVLAHEIAHFVLRHGYRSEETAKNTTLLHTLLSLIRVPIPRNAVDVLFASSVFGYSRSLETEADEFGYKRVTAAGYSANETPKVFEHLIREIDTAGIKEPFFFSTHPKLKDREDNFKQLAKQSPPGGDVLAEAYHQHVMALRLSNLQNELSMGRAKHVLLALCNPEDLEDYPPYVYYYIGEAYRQRGEQGDEISAEENYLEAIREAPEFAPSYRALGVLYYKEGAYRDASLYLTEYLVRAPAAPDHGYVERYLSTAREKLSLQ